MLLYREICYPGDFRGPDGTPVPEVVDHHPLMQGRVDAEIHPCVVDADDLVMRKTRRRSTCRPRWPRR